MYSSYNNVPLSATFNRVHMSSLLLSHCTCTCLNETRPLEIFPPTCVLKVDDSLRWSVMDETRFLWGHPLHVCSNHNETWSSDCEVYRMRCFCSEDTEECKTKKYKHVHVDYYGECRDIPKCSDEEMEDFPRRMREWLFNIMKDLAQRAELDDRYLELEQEAERDLAKKWANAVIWKFCDLDSHPFDRSVSRHELFPIRAPLLAMEHCIAPFLDKCDADDDHRIALKEWGLCLGLEE
ncbi:Secreted protein acidic and rich in cysteine, partial [Araneus ventricosus]